MSPSSPRPARPWAARCAARSAAALSAAVLLALPAAAAPQYGVATLAAVNDTEAGAYTQAGYNATFNYAGWGPVWDQAGASQSSSCNPNLLGCLPVAGSQPGGTNPDATLSTSSARLNVYPGEPYIETQGTAYARAALAGGQLGTAATGQRRPTSRSWIEGTDGWSAARLWETLSFHVAGAAPDTRTTIQVSFEVDGVYAPSDLQMASMNFWFDFGTAHAIGSSQADGYTGGNHPGNWINPVLEWHGVGNMLFTAGYELVGEDTDIGLLMQLQTLGGFGSADFSHTATLSFELPDHVSFTSASGVFLSDDGSGGGGGGGGGGQVPEPPTLALLAAVLLGLRRRSRCA